MNINEKYAQNLKSLSFSLKIWFVFAFWGPVFALFGLLFSPSAGGGPGILLLLYFVFGVLLISVGWVFYSLVFSFLGFLLSKFNLVRFFCSKIVLLCLSVFLGCFAFYIGIVWFGLYIEATSRNFSFNFFLEGAVKWWFIFRKDVHVFFTPGAICGLISPIYVWYFKKK